MLDTIKVVIFAQPGELDNIKRRLENTVPDGVLRNFDYIAEYQDMSIVQHIDETIELGPQLVIVDQRVTKFTFDHIHRLTHERATSPRVVAVFVKSAGNHFEAVSEITDAVYHVPKSSDPESKIINSFRNLNDNLEDLYIEASAEMSSGAAIPEIPPPPTEDFQRTESAAGSNAPFRLRVFTVYSGKGGDGKSTVAREKAYQLGVLGGRKTLLVDADMNRNSFGSIFRKTNKGRTIEGGIHAKPELYNLVTYCSRVLAQVPARLEDYAFPYPSPFTGDDSMLSIMYGIQNIQGAVDDTFIGNGGQNAFAAIQGLLNGADKAGYEFVVFDMGTITVSPVHRAVLEASTMIFAILSPDMEGVVGTANNLKELVDRGSIGRSKISLVLNNWDEIAGISKEKIRELIGAPLRATIPELKSTLMMKARNEGMFFTEAFLEDSSTYSDLGPLIAQVGLLVNYLVPQFVEHMSGQSKLLEKLFKSHRGGRHGDQEGTGKKKKKKRGGMFGG